MSEERIVETLKDYEQPLGIVDSIWSRVRGAKYGLVPTPEDVMQLRKAIKKGKSKWLSMGLTAGQPKWHLVFDGHLLEQQYEEHGGLADKADDSIEALHQTLMKLRERFCGSRTHKQREQSIGRELRRKRCAKIQHHIETYESKIKRETPSKRSLDAQEAREDIKRVKEEKRDACVDN